MAGSTHKLISESFARPANTTALAALDVVGPAVAAVLTFENAARTVGQGGVIRAAKLITDQSTNTSAYRLHIYKIAPAAVIADNALFTELYADRASKVGVIALAAAATEGAGSDAASTQNIALDLPYECDDDDTSLYGVLETVGGFTPASGQGFHITLSVKQD